ncbi:MAG: fibrobacter succinogenes major paralogous domain-containing protein [Crocinitomicaceae bacterium]|nr:fibrobacter succinogenes major paralogous domain-containing protein [Crocinitomicaceae bacterium]
MNVKFIFAFALMMLFSMSCSEEGPDTVQSFMKQDKQIADTINDAFLKDSSIFSSITIGGQSWMKSDLQLTEFLNGDPIPEVSTDQDWVKYAKLKKPCFRRKGKSVFYNGFVLMDERGLVPDDFKIPTASDWENLMNELGGLIPMSKSIATYQWDEKIQGETISYSGNNASEFTALPGGFVYTSGSISSGNCSFWWVNSTEQSLIPSKLTIFNIGFCSSDISSGTTIDPAFGATLRCIKKK